MQKIAPEGKSLWMLTMTIHELETYNDPSASYYIKWSRGTHKGSTERAVPAGGGPVVFEKSLSIPCTIIKHRGKIAPKEMNFVAKMILGKKKKAIGDFKLDLAPFVGLAPIVCQSFAMRATKSTPPILRLSICLAQSTSLDHSDISESIDAKPRQVPKRMKRVGSMSVMAPPVTPAPSLEHFAKPKPALPRTMTRRMGMSQVLYLSENSRQIGSFGGTRPDLASPKTAPSIEYEEIKNLCSMEWRDDGFGEWFHGIDSVLFACLEYFHVFDVEATSDENFASFVARFWKMLKGSAILNSLGDDMRFCPIFGFCVLLRWPPPGFTIEKRRAERLVDSMKEFMHHEFDLLLEKHVGAFRDAVAQVFRKDFDVDATANMFTQTLKKMRDDGSVPLLMVDVVEKGMVRKLDAVLVAKLCSGDSQCNFFSSLAWNTFCSRMRSQADMPMEFTLFTEAVAVVQMTAVIEDNPEVVKDICPHLTPNTVLSILSVRETDEDLQTQPNLEKFASKFGIDPDEGFTPIPLDAMDLMDAKERLTTDGWTNITVPNSIVENFPFLMDYFK